MSRVSEDLRQKFLNPSEWNRADLITLIQQAFDALPSNLEEDNPFLGEAINFETILSEFEKIPLQPKNRKKILTTAVSMLKGQIRWHSPATLHNINSPVMLDAVAVASIVNLYNPNMLWDFISSGMHLVEQQLTRQIASLVGWESEIDGCFTFGGKACLMYAIRIGLNRCLPGVSMNGLSKNQSPVVITSEYNHYIIENVCSLLGLGKNACIRVKAKKNETLNLLEFRNVLEKIIQQQRPIACIILSGGNTLHIAIDPLREVCQIIDELQNKYRLPYRPYVYFDTVVGWPWLFFKQYDFMKNPFDFDKSTIKKIKYTLKLISDALLADAVGIDFHKIGFCPYATSLFVTQRAAELHSIAKDTITKQERQPFGYNFLQHYTLEHSRGAAPVLSAWVILQNAGVEGFQSYIGHLTKVGEVFSKILPQYNFELLNAFSLGFASVYCPIAENANYTYESILKSSPETIDKYNQYVFKVFQEIQENKAKGLSKLVLRYLPKYRQAECGNWPSVIAVYPMSLYIPIEKAEALAHRIGKSKKTFDKKNQNYQNKEEPPEAIHK